MMLDCGQKHKALGKQFLFIVGAPRSGTTWLQLLLAAHPSICASAELRLYDQYLRPWLESWQAEARLSENDKPYIGLPVLWQESEFRNFLKGFLDEAYAKLLATKTQATHILDKHPGYSRFVGCIDSFIPHAKFIHLIRDGRDVAVSLFEASRQMGWFAKLPLHDYGKVWRDQVLAARNAAKFEGRYLELRYEDLSASPSPTLKAVFAFCGITSSDELIDSIVEQNQFEKLVRSRSTPAKGIQLPAGHFRKGKVGCWREKFSSINRYLFDEVAGDLLRELRYADEYWWAERALQKAWMPLAAIAPKAYRVCRRLGPAGAVLLGRRTTVRV